MRRLIQQHCIDLTDHYCTSYIRSSNNNNLSYKTWHIYIAEIKVHVLRQVLKWLCYMASVVCFWTLWAQQQLLQPLRSSYEILSLNTRLLTCRVFFACATVTGAHNKNTAETDAIFVCALFPCIFITLHLSLLYLIPLMICFLWCGLSSSSTLSSMLQLWFLCHVGCVFIHICRDYTNSFCSREISHRPGKKPWHFGADPDHLLWIWFFICLNSGVYVIWNWPW